MSTPHPLSVWAQNVSPSPTLEIDAKAKAMMAAGDDVCSFAAGEPDFDTPEFIKEAAIAALRSGKTKYAPTPGVEALRVAIAARYGTEYGYEVKPSQVVVSPGGKFSCFIGLQSVCNPGDDILVPAPYWVSYPDIVQFAGGTPVIIMATAAQNYKITPEQLDAAITPKTRWLILNSPSNPTGAAYNATELEALGQVLLRHAHVMLLTDDMYEHIWYAQSPFATMLEVCPELYDRTLTMNGASKAYAMTGWRIGYAGGPEWLIKAMGALQSQSTSNPCSISQYAVLAALNGPQDFLKERNAAFKERRDLVVAMLNDAPGLSCPTPEGAFYVYPDASGVIGKTTAKGKKIETDADLIDYFLDDYRVAAVHGAAFGLSPGFRISYATSTELLKEACTRIQSACAALV